ncbi:low molecular weight protein-tyrosine-phosphatase [Streptobacillus felis]|uniref:low molecular weight protein-tyrosine-phosphatase n=1 Tax=Streptobacillus felis TaxID=1384509 RepID=UPI000829AC13|nr:low molecular weight protein-tyrosine-phosphatase [Streptobacillus felis]
MIKVLFVCHGNICRSTMAESMFTNMVKNMNCYDDFLIDSAATSTEEIGNPPHYGTVKKLKEKNIPIVEHYARQITREDFINFDYIIAMDENNIRNIERFLKHKNDKVYKLLNFNNTNDDITDPWYTNDFEKTYLDIKKGLEAFIKKIK